MPTRPSPAVLQGRLQHAPPFEVFEGYLSCSVLGCLLAGALTWGVGGRIHLEG